jgi:pyrimidine deaminase RibD-like protein
MIATEQMEPWYEDAKNDASDSFFEDDRFEEWLADADLDTMSGIARNYDIQWPHYTSSGNGGTSVQDVADSFSAAVGRPAKASTSYHDYGVERPGPGKNFYVVEPDGSIETDDPMNAGLEFVSPPLPIDQMMSDLNKVKKWADRMGCYTNDSTGLHINISVPNYSQDKLDFVKLALLMGDEYVLQQFGRASNTYAKSAMGKIRSEVGKGMNGARAKAVLEKMTSGMEELASKAIHSGITEKYTSINTKTGHVEFRSPGGDWLGDNFGLIENTLLRFTVALSAAMDPKAYREEYLKKLYKVLNVANEGDPLAIFARYAAGQGLPATALKSFVRQAQAERKAKKSGEEIVNIGRWRVKLKPELGGGAIEVMAKDAADARQQAIKKQPDWQFVHDDSMTITRLDEPAAGTSTTQSHPQGRGRPNDPNGRLAIVNRDDPLVFAYSSGTPSPAPDYLFRFTLGDGYSQAQLRSVLAAWAARENANAADYMIVDTTQFAAPEQTAAPESGSVQWNIINGNDEIVHTFWNRNVQADANEAARQWLISNDSLPSVDDQEPFEVVPVAIPGSTLDLQRQRMAADTAANTRRWADYEASQAPTPVAGVQDIEPDVEQYTSQPAQTQWEVYDRSTDRPVFRMYAADQAEAWRKGQEWVANYARMTPDQPIYGIDYSVRQSTAPVSESISVLERRLRQELDALGNQPPTGPETPPEMPAGTIKVDVSDMYDWYKLGQHISNLKGIDKSTLGTGPPHTVFAFGSEELENKYSHELTNLGLKTHDLDEPGEEDVDESQEITKLGKLDSVLEKCIEMIRHGHETNPDKYGRVAACLIDNKNNHTYAINMPGPGGTRRHAERMAIAKHLKRHGRIGPNAIMVTTLSPCVDHMDERYGESCTDLLSDYGIEKCYAGWQDPTQHPAEDYPFNLKITDNADIFNTCKDIAASFLPQAMAEAYTGPPMKFLRPGELSGSYTPQQMQSMGFKQSANGAWYIPMNMWQRLVSGGQIKENFADGRNPQDKGDAKRHGINTKASVSSLRKTAKQGGRKGQLAHWLANMKAGRAKAKRKTNEDSEFVDTISPGLVADWDDQAGQIRYTKNNVVIPYGTAEYNAARAQHVEYRKNLKYNKLKQTTDPVYNQIRSAFEKEQQSPTKPGAAIVVPQEMFPQDTIKPPVKYDDPTEDDFMAEDYESMVEAVDPQTVSNFTTRARDTIEIIAQNADPKYQKAIRKMPVKILNGNPSNPAYIQGDTVHMDAEEWWDAPSEVLLFVMAHEVGHILFEHGIRWPWTPPATIQSDQQEEMDGDKFALQIVKKLGIKKIPVWTWLRRKKNDLEEYKRRQEAAPPGPWPTFKQRSDQALGFGVELVKANTDQIDHALEQIQDMVA